MFQDSRHATGDSLKPEKYIESCEVTLIIENETVRENYPFNKSQSESVAGFH